MGGYLVDSRLGVAQAILVFESFARGGGTLRPSRAPRSPWPDDQVSKLGEEINRLQRSGHASAISAQAGLVWNLAVHRKKSTVWFLRTHCPAMMLVVQMCQVGAIPCERLLAGHFEVRDFPVLTNLAGKLAYAPLMLCDARPAGAFLDSLTRLSLAKAPCFALCDWILEGRELAMARRAAREAGITFLCPA